MSIGRQVLALRTLVARLGVFWAFRLFYRDQKKGTLVDSRPRRDLNRLNQLGQTGDHYLICRNIAFTLAIRK